MASHSIKVVRGCQGEIRDVLRAWFAGDIKDKDVLCDHHDCKH